MLLRARPWIAYCICLGDQNKLKHNYYDTSSLTLRMYSAEAVRLRTWRSPRKRLGFRPSQHTQSIVGVFIDNYMYTYSTL